MTIKQSGLWCDMCKCVILGEWWHITLGMRRFPAHACKTCFDKHATKENVHTKEAREALIEKL